MGRGADTTERATVKAWARVQVRVGDVGRIFCVLKMLLHRSLLEWPCAEKLVQIEQCVQDFRAYTVAEFNGLGSALCPMLVRSGVIDLFVACLANRCCVCVRP